MDILSYDIIEIILSYLSSADLSNIIKSTMLDKYDKKIEINFIVKYISEMRETLSSYMQKK